jgi:hypothetical protein
VGPGGAAGFEAGFAAGLALLLELFTILRRWLQGNGEVSIPLCYVRRLDGIAEVRRLVAGFRVWRVWLRRSHLRVDRRAAPVAALVDSLAWAKTAWLGLTMYAYINYYVYWG